MAYEEIGVSHGVKCKNHSLDEPEVKKLKSSLKGVQN